MRFDRGGLSWLAFQTTTIKSKRYAQRFKKAGAETLDAAREQWWIGLRDAEAVAYSKPEHFAREENTFRSGFAAALEPPVRGRSFDQAAEYLSSRNYPEAYRKESFRQGFERGRHYYEKLAQAEVGR